MALKHSIFNFFYSRGTDEIVVYNTFSKGLVSLSKSEYSQFQELQFNTSELETALSDNGILIDEQFDEIKFLKYFHYKTKFANDSLILTIAPTLDCNFGCPYCYENRRAGKMSEEVQKGVLDYIEKAVKSGVSYLNITWYGGEPLLYFDIVKNMSASVCEITRRNNCRLKMDMVTNGFFLDEATVEALDTLGISKIQVTLDGLKENHDKRRHLLGGQGTFDRIFENLKLFDDSPMSVLVRMNVDNENCDDFEKLKKLIDDLGNTNIRVYASPVEDLNKDKVNEISEFMTNDEFDRFTIEAGKKGDLSEDDFSVMDDRYCFCTAQTENCYVIDEDGDFYKCWDEVGRKEYKCFNVLHPEERNNFQIASFVADDPFSDEKCKGCVFLPVCFGGCQFQKTHLVKSPCGFTRETMISYIENNYFEES